ncbi:hypothetical protein NGRA_0144 [Nosema granulosis]|uniref:Secreted protein n=1 Tax=Nosema granulosis TaxID=83296 RepID=A0A9P6H3I7_9MICR|nr:hypothetical protein NGRA_0144 [Nosema granulosis]
MLALLSFACCSLCSGISSVENDSNIRTNITIFSSGLHISSLSFSDCNFMILNGDTLEILFSDNVTIDYERKGEVKIPFIHAEACNKTPREEAATKFMILRYQYNPAPEKMLTLFKVVDVYDFDCDEWTIEEVYDEKALKRYFIHFLYILMNFLFENFSLFEKIDLRVPKDPVHEGIKKLIEFIDARDEYIHFVGDNNSIYENCKTLLNEVTSLLLSKTSKIFEEKAELTLEEFNFHFIKLKEELINKLKEIHEVEDFSSLYYTLHDPDLLVTTILNVSK